MKFNHKDKVKIKTPTKVTWKKIAGTNTYCCQEKCKNKCQITCRHKPGEKCLEGNGPINVIRLGYIMSMPTNANVNNIRNSIFNNL